MRKVISSIFMYIIMAFVILISAFPILWVIMSSFKSNGEILTSALALPSSFDLSVYISLFTDYSFPRYFLNSILVSSASALFSLFIFAMSAYVIAKYRFPGRMLLFVLFTVTLLVPAHSRTQPIFSLVMNLGLYNRLAGVTLVYLSAGLAMSLFLLRSGFMSVPDSLSEAAEIEGAGFFRTFWSVNLPLVKSSLSTAGILMFLNNWNEFYFASLLTSSDSVRTLPIALSFFTSEFSYNYTYLFAALTVVILPGIVIYAFASDQVQASVAASGVKG